MSKLFFVMMIFGFPSIGTGTRELFVNTNESISFTDNRSILLTGAGKKSWYLYSQTSERMRASCKASNIVFSDNTYTFHSDGTFEFDHGTITEDPSCEDCCTDLINVVGSWKFTKNQKGLRITSLHEKNNKENAQKLVLFDAAIDQLDEDVLRFSQVEPKSMVRYTFEFRKQ